MSYRVNPVSQIESAPCLFVNGHYHANRVCRDINFGTLHPKLHNRIDLNRVLCRRRSFEYNLRAMCKFHETTAPGFFGGIVRVAIHHIKQRGSIAQLGVSVQVIFKVLAQVSAAIDISIVVQTVEFVHLFVVGNESAVRGIVFDDPKVREILHNIGVTVGAPFFIRAAYPVHSYVVFNIGSIVQSLGQIIQASPYKHP